MGLDYKKIEKEGILDHRFFSFDSLHFPACNSCNSQYSSFEASCKRIIEKVLEEEYLSSEEVDLLLDWFDKVRTGLWLGFNVLDGQGLQTTPNFQINSRIAKKDRLLMVFDIGDEFKGLNFIGNSLPIFKLMPCCFGLAIQNKLFVNISTDLFLSKDVGFPFPRSAEFLEGNQGKIVGYSFSPGKNSISMGAFLRKLADPRALILFQPIFPVWNNDFEINESNLYYLLDNMLYPNKGKGNIFYIHNRGIQRLSTDREIILKGRRVVKNRLDFSEELGRLLDQLQRQVAYINKDLFYKPDDITYIQQLIERYYMYQNKITDIIFKKK